MLVRAKDIRMVYGATTVLNGINFEVHAGDTISLRGESGCGKSTLLSVLGLLLPPTSGEVLVGGRPVSWKDDRELSRVRGDEFGFVFQHTQLIGSLRVLDNVLVTACFSFQGDKYDRAVELLGEMGLSDRLDYYPHQLSVGQRRRVALARALLLEPPLVIADEPTNDLDAAHAAVVGDLLLSYADDDRAVVLATHDEGLAWRCARQLRLDSGRLYEMDAGGGAAGDAHAAAEGARGTRAAMGGARSAAEGDYAKGGRS